jgi:putative transposase
LGGQRGRLISLEDKMQTIELINEATNNGTGKDKACAVLDISLRSFQRWEKERCGDKRKGALKNVPRKLSETEKQKVIDTACDKQFKDLTPYEIVAILAEQGIYIASERTFYRILNMANMLHHRGNWCWDITFLKTPVHGLYYYCYMIKDIWTKEIVGWEIHETEDVEIASVLFRRLQNKYKLRGIKLHSDNGNPMKGTTMIMTLYTLGVIPSFSRPRVSNDNPYIESLFKTLKYTAGYPGHFKDLDHARVWMAEFVNWYNTEHRHSAIGFVTPNQRRSGEYKEIIKARNKTMEQARLLNPERWGKKIRIWDATEEIFLNPNEDTKERLNQKKVA